MLREKRMLEDIKDAIEKRRDLEVKDMQGATAVGFQYGSIKTVLFFFQEQVNLCA